MEQFSQHPGRYLGQLDSGSVFLTSATQIHNPSLWLQNLHVLHLRYASLVIVQHITMMHIILSQT